MQVFYNEKFKCYLSPLMSTSPFVEVPEGFNMTKNTKIKVGTRQKEDSNGNLLFIKDIFETRTHEKVIGYTETLKSNINGKPLEPVLIKVQKTDDDGNYVYYKVNDMGGTDETLEETEYPVMIEVHKTNSAGRFLYKNPTIQIIEEEVKTGEEEVTEDTGRPVMEDILKEIEVTLRNDSIYFTIQEIIANKYEDMLKKYNNNIIYKEFIDLNDVSLFKGNTGLGFVQMSPKSKIKFKTIAIEGKCNAIKLLEFLGDSRIEISVGGRILKGEEIRLKDNNNLKQMTLTLSNNTDDYLTINRIAVLAYFKEPTKEEKLTARLNSIESTMTQMQSAIDEVILGVM